MCIATHEFSMLPDEVSGAKFSSIKHMLGYCRTNGAGPNAVSPKAAAPQFGIRYGFFRFEAAILLEPRYTDVSVASRSPVRRRNIPGQDGNTRFVRRCAC